MAMASMGAQGAEPSASHWPGWTSAPSRSCRLIRTSRRRLAARPSARPCASADTRAARARSRSEQHRQRAAVLEHRYAHPFHEALVQFDPDLAPPASALVGHQQATGRQAQRFLQPGRGIRGRRLRRRWSEQPEGRQRRRHPRRVQGLAVRALQGAREGLAVGLVRVAAALGVAALARVPFRAALRQADLQAYPSIRAHRPSPRFPRPIRAAAMRSTPLPRLPRPPCFPAP